MEPKPTSLWGDKHLCKGGEGRDGDETAGGIHKLPFTDEFEILGRLLKCERADWSGAEDAKRQQSMVQGRAVEDEVPESGGPSVQCFLFRL